MSQPACAAGGMLATARLTGQTAGAAAVALIFRVQGRETSNTALVAAAAVAALAAGVSLLRLARPSAATATP